MNKLLIRPFLELFFPEAPQSSAELLPWIIQQQQRSKILILIALLILAITVLLGMALAGVMVVEHSEIIELIQKLKQK